MMQLLKLPFDQNSIMILIATSFFKEFKNNTRETCNITLISKIKNSLFSTAKCKPIEMEKKRPNMHFLTRVWLPRKVQYKANKPKPKPNVNCIKRESLLSLRETKCPKNPDSTHKREQSNQKIEMRDSEACKTQNLRLEAASKGWIYK